MNQHYKARDNQGLMDLFYQGQLLEQQDVDQLLSMWAILKAQVKPAGWGGGHAPNRIYLFCPWRKIKDNIESNSAEKLHRKFIYMFQEPESTLDAATSDP